MKECIFPHNIEMAKKVFGKNSDIIIQSFNNIYSKANSPKTFSEYEVNLVNALFLVFMTAVSETLDPTSFLNTNWGKELH